MVGGSKLNTKKVFCEHCRKDVFYSEKEQLAKTELKGETFDYLEKVATCDECSNELFVDELNDYNLQTLYNEFRNRHNIISLDMILEIPEKFNIGKRPLSILLGWGEQTFSRYCDGDMPTQQYSAILQRVYDDPSYFFSILEKNREKITQLAYEKSKQATEALLCSSQTPGSTKIDTVVNYILCLCEDTSPLALQKLLYYIQGFYFAFYGRFMFEKNFEAWVHGPAYGNVYFKYKDYKFDPIECEQMVNDQSLTSNEKTIINSVIRNFGCYSGKILEAFTHSEQPWLKTRGDLSSLEPTKKKISNELIGDYFNTVKEKYNMLNPSDIGDYSRKMFDQIRK